MECELTIVMPCLNEAETLPACIRKARSFLEGYGISGEIVIADNGSTDGSPSIAEAHGARVIHVPVRGYGAALMGGIEAARGCYVVMGDADDSYDFASLEQFILKLREGYDLVMGNRFKGIIMPGAMPFLNRFIGNPALTWIGRLFFHSPVGDFHCGLRGFKRKAIQNLNLQTTGMEFASEMVVKATLHQLRIAEVPTTLSPDGRSHPPHLKRWRDGWRHLRFLLIYSPTWLFLYPGIMLIAFGLLVMFWLLPAPRTIGGVTFDIHTMLYAAMSVILGLQAVFFAAFSKVFAAGIKLVPEDRHVASILHVISLERGIIFGAALFLAGLAGSVYAVTFWGSSLFGPLTPSSIMRIIIPSVTAVTAGIQIILGSFFLSTLQLAHK